MTEDAASRLTSEQVRLRNPTPGLQFLAKDNISVGQLLGEVRGK